MEEYNSVEELIKGILDSSIKLDFENEEELLNYLPKLHSFRRVESLREYTLDELEEIDDCLYDLTFGH